MEQEISKRIDEWVDSQDRNRNTNAYNQFTPLRLQPYGEEIKGLMDRGFGSVRVRRYLNEMHDLNIARATVARFMTKVRAGEIAV